MKRLRNLISDITFLPTYWRIMFGYWKLQRALRRMNKIIDNELAKHT